MLRSQRRYVARCMAHYGWSRWYIKLIQRLTASSHLAAMLQPRLWPDSLHSQLLHLPILYCSSFLPHHLCPFHSRCWGHHMSDPKYHNRGEHSNLSDARPEEIACLAARQRY